MQPLSPRANQAILEHDYAEQASESIALSHVVRSLVRYKYVIALSLIGVLVLYGILALAYYLLQPPQRVTTLSFRLEFTGAEKGEYPNGTKFGSAEIVSTPVLMQVFRSSDLGRFISFKDFSQSVFIVESNRALEQLARRYQGKLSDPKMNAVERERLEREYDLKRESLSRSEYSINFMTTTTTKNVPPALIDKTLNNILSTWASTAAREKGVVRYRLPVLSKNILNREILGGSDFVVALDILRTRVDSVIRNIEELLQVPGAEVLRTGKDEVSLSEIRLRLADIVRFRVQPLIVRIRTGGATPEPRSTLRFLQSQLDYNRLQAKAAEARSSALRDSLNIYRQEQTARTVQQTLAGRGAQNPEREMVMPQISDTFLDRLVDLTKEKNDLEYRQKLVDRITEASINALPFRQEESYYQQLIDQMRGLSPSAGQAAENAAIRQELLLAFNEVAIAIDQVGGIYELLSQNLNPSTLLFTITSPPITRIERSVSVIRLALYGFLLMLISLPIIIGACLLHNRVREEKELEDETKDEHRQTEMTLPEYAGR